ncbi:MAG: TIGR00730 family Rossman fold protein [Candidatus Magasanikbacteria bacterium]|nr:TIGR00730 family Rossman fold protein [Candidatus Magasanikbacteria bacterium]
MPKSDLIKEAMPVTKASVKPDLTVAAHTSGEMINYRDSWRIFRVVSEFVEGYQLLGELTKEVTIMGSARLPANSKYYHIAEELGYLLGKNGFTTITGGGPGIMEAANKGAFEAGGESVGINIQLPMEQRINPYVKKSAAFFYFFSRKVMLTAPANAFVFFPGGFGTLDEFFEVVDYIEMGHMPKVPIIMVGKEFWEPIINFLRAKSAREVNSINEADLNQWHVVDTAKEAFEFIKDTEDRPNPWVKDPSSPFYQGDLNWRIFRIMAEMVDGFEFLTKIQRDVTVLGTSSILQGSPYYQAAYELGKILADQQYATITGGGPGIMEAANKGAFERGGQSLGINMRTERGERINNYVTQSIGFFFPYIRKLIITAPSEAFVFFPGGFGTLHQLFEILTLQETNKIKPIPTLLYGREFWQPLLDIVHNLHDEFKTITRIDEDFLKLMDSPQDILQHLKK